MRQTDLELKFKRGELSTQEFLEQSGAIAHYMASHGAPLEQIVQTVQEAQAQQEIESWRDAVQTFLTTASGADWPGNSKNLEMIGLQIQSLGLVDASDKVAALAQAYQSMKQKGILFPPEVAVQAANELAALQEAMGSATSAEEVRQAVEQYKSNLQGAGVDANTHFVQTFSRNGTDTPYNPVTPSGEPRSSGIFGR